VPFVAQTFVGFVPFVAKPSWASCPSWPYLRERRALRGQAFVGFVAFVAQTFVGFVPFVAKPSWASCPAPSD
jgi:hypothetical protein